MARMGGCRRFSGEVWSCLRGGIEADQPRSHSDWIGWQ